QKASARGGQGAVPQEQLEQHQMLHNLTDQLRSGQITNQQVVNVLRQGGITRQQAERVLKESKLSALGARVQSLPIADALDVYEIATSQERAELHNLMMKKVEGFSKTQADRTPAQNAFLSQRVRRTLGLSLGSPTIH